MISAAEVMPLLLEACPSFAPAWSELEHDPINIAEDGSRLGYLDASAFAKHIVERARTGDISEVGPVFSVIERLLLEGDPYVRELAAIGYLEDIQLEANSFPERTWWFKRPKGFSAAVFEPFLGTEAARWWRGLQNFWSKKARTVQPTD